MLGRDAALAFAGRYHGESFDQRPPREFPASKATARCRYLRTRDRKPRDRRRWPLLRPRPELRIAHSFRSDWIAGATYHCSQRRLHQYTQQQCVY